MFILCSFIRAPYFYVTIFCYGSDIPMDAHNTHRPQVTNLELKAPRHQEDAHGFDISFGSPISVIQSRRAYIQIKAVGFNFDLLRLPILDNVPRIVEVVIGDLDEVWRNRPIHFGRSRWPYPLRTEPS